MIKEETDRQIVNERARVTRHKMAAGAHTGFHRHEYDSVIVRSLMGGCAFSKPMGWVIGIAYFRPAILDDVVDGYISEKFTTWEDAKVAQQNSNENITWKVPI